MGKFDRKVQGAPQEPPQTTTPTHPRMSQLLNAKMCILGDQSVGKSSIAVRWVRGSFSDNTESTIGAAFLTRQVDLPEVSVKLQIWDTAGQERYSVSDAHVLSQRGLRHGG